MARLPQNQQQALDSFQAVGHASRSEALRILREHNFDVQASLNYFFSVSPSPEEDMTQMEQAFRKYAVTVNDTDIITFEGFSRLSSDVGLPMDDIRWLIFLWKGDASQMGEITQEEFLTGCKALGAYNFPHLQQKLADCNNIIANRRSFSDFYKWLFGYLKESPDHRSIVVAHAEVAWRKLFADWSLLEDWIDFVKNHRKLKLINRDLWTELFGFINTVGSDLSKFSADDAWPSVIDSFCDWKMKQQ
ncbi:hypothetical protein GEMRC1_006276 [Eukaryota sp. GEM-RC1]